MNNFTYDEYGTSEVIDSRDIIERVDELSMFEADDDPDEIVELVKLRALVDAFKDETDEWDDGATLILDSYFKEYAIELVNECGYFQVQRDPYSNKVTSPDWDRWPYNCIDWDAVADGLKADYGSVEYDGSTYWVRSV